MLKKLVLFLAAACISTGSLSKADDLIAQPPSPLQIIFDRSACLRLIDHHPSPDVTYTPGVSVDGHPVVPAELPGSTSSLDTTQLEKQVTIPVTRELANRMGPLRQYFKAEATLGLVEVDEAGQLLFNGQPIEAQNEAPLDELCRNVAAED